MEEVLAELVENQEWARGTAIGYEATATLMEHYREREEEADTMKRETARKGNDPVITRQRATFRLVN